MDVAWTIIIFYSAIQRGIVTEEEAKELQEKDVINLIFEPHFTTKPVVSELSGRGIGMDVVKKNLEKWGPH